MEKKKAIDLIKLEVLDCLNIADAETLHLSKEVDSDFPWKELGEYQNLAAFLSVALPLEFPVSELKDKVALKLYNMRDEIKAKLDAKRKPEEPPVLIEDEKEIIDEEFIVEETYVPVIEEEISPLSVSGRIEQKRTEEISAKSDLRSKVTFDKELVEKTVKEYFKSHFEPELKSIRNSMKRNFVISLVLFAISLILIVILFVMGLT
ncbi:MAG TPA: hypothetical protein VLH59_09730 [Ignavibacteriaceae bacterium]|nr:hypothetical protein [Ignavibacteriaceae bacterium]